MTSDEAPMLVARESAGILMTRQRTDAVHYQSPSFYGSYARYEHGLIVPDPVPARRRRSFRRQQTSKDGAGVYMTYFPRPWQYFNASADAFSDVVSISLVKGGILVPPLPAPKELHAPNPCPKPGCVDMWVRMTVPPASLSAQNATPADIEFFSRTLKCLHWSLNPVVRMYEWKDNVCQVGNVTHRPANNSVLIQCRCNADGYVYAQWIRSPQPSRFAVSFTTLNARTGAWPSMAFLAATGFFLAVLFSVLYASLLHRFSMHGMHYLTLRSNSVVMHLHTNQSRIRSLERVWMEVLSPNFRDQLISSFEGHKPYLMAETGIVSFSNNQSPNKASSDERIFWEKEQVRYISSEKLPKKTSLAPRHDARAYILEMPGDSEAYELAKDDGSNPMEVSRSKYGMKLQATSKDVARVRHIVYLSALTRAQHIFQVA
jgi:hypothetical protein